MFQYFTQRLWASVPVVLGVVTLTFLLIHMVPGDPIEVILGDQATAVNKQVLRQQMGLDLPLIEQYKNFMLGFAQGDLGESLYSRQPVTELIIKHFPATFELTFAAILMALFIGIPAGVLAAVKQYSKWDNSLVVASLLGMSLPGIFLGPMLIWVFSIRLDLFPVSERGGLEHLFLPALSLALPLGAVLLRITRASVLEVVKEDYIRVARSKGLTGRVIYFKHALSNALIPVITTVGLQVGALLTGTVITETIFDWPGLGTLLFASIQQRDYPLVQGCILIIALIYILVNFLTDILYAFANPKIRLEGS